MDKILFVTMLFDFYGELLTDKQKSVIELYYLNDLSLQEIAEEEGITRQAVQDTLKRTVKILEEYEDTLLLVDKYIKQKEKLDSAIINLDKLIDKYKLNEVKEFLDIKKLFSGILD